MKLSEVLAALKLPCAAEIELSGIFIDSRQVQPQGLFVAIRGGHDFILDAIQQGAVAVLCTTLPSNLSVPCFMVDDTIKALGTMARYHRQHQTAKIIALTGSNGKTTVKEMIACILPKPAHATRGNLNNHIGVPLSVLQLESQHRFAVFELGANHSGEIAYSASIVKPDIGLINNIGPAHIEGFGSIEGVAQAKGEIYASLAQGGIAIVNDDDEFAHFWDAALKPKSVIRFSANHKADIYATEISYNDNGHACFMLHIGAQHVRLTLRVPGRHQVLNALAAAACCHAAGIDLGTIVNGLASFSGVAGRLTLKPGKNNAKIIDDTYNANLRSVLAAVDFLATCRGRRILVLGDLGELGTCGNAHHSEIGVKAKALSIDYLFTYGNLSQFAAEAFGERAQHFTDRHALIKALMPYLDVTTTILVKGSRSAKMETFVKELELGV